MKINADFIARHGDPAPFTVGKRVLVKSCVEDFHFFNGRDKGTVKRNSLDYLGIIVEFDQPRVYKDGRVMTEFNFNPRNLEIITVDETQFV